MRILILAESFDIERGYAEYYIAKELIEQGHDVHVLSFTQRKLKIEVVEGIQIIWIPYRWEFSGLHFPTMIGLRKAIEFLQKWKPKIILCWPLFSPLSIMMSSLHKLSGGYIAGGILTGGPIVTSFGMYTPSSLTSLLRYILAKFVVKTFVNRTSDVIFAISKGVGKILQNSFGTRMDKIRVMHLGADPKLFVFNKSARKSIRGMLGILDDDIVIVYSGRITPDKNLNLLLSAFAEISESDPKSKVLIVGNGNASFVEAVKRKAKFLGVEEKVIFHKSVHRTELSKFYSASDIAVWPGSPSISIIEAASSRLPIVIMDSPFTSYLVSNENGFVFSHGNKTNLKEHLRTLLENPTLRNVMSQKSRELVENRLNWEIITKRAIREIVDVIVERHTTET